MGDTHFPNKALIPFDFFLPSGEVGSVCVLSLSADRCGIPARSRWSVPSRSVSAVCTQNYITHHPKHGKQRGNRVSGVHNDSFVKLR